MRGVRHIAVRVGLLGALLVLGIGVSAAADESVPVSVRASGGEMTGEDVRLWSTIGTPTNGGVLVGAGSERVLPGSPVVAQAVPEPSWVLLQLAALGSLLALVRRRRHAVQSLAIAGLALVVLAPTVEASDGTIRHQGLLVDEQGVPVDGVRDLAFSLFTNAQGAEGLVWSEAHNGVSVANGLFEVRLGSSAPFEPGLFDDQTDLWLETSVSGAPLTPRVALTSVPSATDTDGLGGRSPAEFQQRVSPCKAGRFIRSIDSEGVVECSLGTRGERGDQGPAGPQGVAFQVDTATIDTQALAPSAVTSEKLATGAVTTTSLADSFTLDAARVGGLLRDQEGFGIPEALKNTTTVEINSIDFAGETVHIVKGPGAVTERLDGLVGKGTPVFLPGFTRETDFAFSYRGVAESSLQSLHEAYLLGPDLWQLADMSIIVRDLAGTEVYRLTLLQWGLASISGGPKGSLKRYTFEKPGFPDANLAMFADGDFGQSTMGLGLLESRNLATDRRVEIGSVVTGAYPAVVIDTRAKSVMLTYDWVEGCCLLDWYTDTVEGIGVKTEISVIEESAEGAETSRLNFFGVFPYRYESLTGFGLKYRMKARIWLSYDSASGG
jgi:hypothetical protein